MRKIGLICLALVLALGVMGAGYAAWGQLLNVNADITSAIPPTVVTNAATTVGAHTATINANLTVIGTKTTVNDYFEWGSTPTTVAGNPATRTTLGTYYYNITSGLLPSTTYTFRAKAVGYFTSYGGDLTFTTTADLAISTTSPLANGTVSTPYSQTIAATGGRPSYTWSNQTALPAGLSLNPSTGVISGTPTAAGTTTFNVTATDSSTAPADTATRLFSLTIVSGTTTLHLNPTSATDTTSGSPGTTLDSTDLGNLATSNNNRYQVDDEWSTSYGSKYLNFNFSAGVPTGKTINTVNLNFEWQAQSHINGAQLLISGNNGSSWTTVSLTVPSADTDSTVTLDLKTVSNGSINTVDEVNALVIRFRATRNSSSNDRRTLHDWVEVDVTYQ